MFKQLLIHVRDVRESDLDPIGGNQVKRARRSFSGGTTKAKLTRHKRNFGCSNRGFKNVRK